MSELSRNEPRRRLNLRLIPVVLASAYLVSVPLGFAGLCFYNWAAEWWAGLALLLASVGLWLGGRWGYLVAAAASSSIIYRFCYAALKVHHVLPVRPEEDAEWLAPGMWWGYILRLPESYLPLALAMVVFTCAAYGLMKRVLRRRPMLP